jgi:hypothetical protein
MIQAQGYAWVLVAFAGVIVGASELVARYRDDPWRAIWNGPGFGYLFVNGAAAVLTFLCLMVIAPGWIDVATVDTVDAAGAAHSVKTNTLTAKGFLTSLLASTVGSAAILRSAIFKLKVDNNDVSIGFAAIVDIFLSATDRAVDRKRAEPRAEAVGKIMENVSFQKAQSALRAYCFALMQNVPGEEQKRFADQISALARDPMDDRVKTGNLGLALMDVVGERVLRQAVGNLRTFITADPPFQEGQVAQTANLMEKVDFVKAILLLPMYCATLRSDIGQDKLAALAGKLETIGKLNLPEDVKSLSLGLELANTYGLPATTIATEKLRASITR